MSLTDETTSDLEVERRAVDEIDADIVRLLAERRRITDAMGDHKREVGLPVQMPHREAEIVANVRATADGTDLGADDAEAIFRLALAQSRAAQHAARADQPR